MNETIIPCNSKNELDQQQYWLVVVNPDGSNIWGANWSTYKMVAYYSEDTNYKNEYYCEAPIGMSINSIWWRIFRIRTNKVTNKFYDKTFSGTLFDKLATDLATVESYTYN